MKRLTISFLMLILLVIGITILAQEIPPGCDLAALSEQITINAADLSAVPLDEALTILSDLQNSIASQSAACGGLAFNSDNEGFQPVIGPVELPDGIWKVTFTTGGYVLLNATTLTGDCGGYDDEFLILSAGKGDAVKGKQEVMTTSDSCSLLLTVGMADEDWTLEFTLVKPA